MKDDKPQETASEQFIACDRRKFLSQGLATMAGLLLFNNPAMGKLLDIDIRSEEPAEQTPPPAGGLSDYSSRRDRPVPAIAKPFLDETITFNIKFMAAKTATGTLTFRRTSNWKYTATMKAVIAGAVSPLVKYRSQEMSAVMLPTKVGDKERFVTTNYYRKTITTEGMTERIHEFNYRRRKWKYTKIKNGQKKYTKIRKIPKKIYYDDFVNVVYNFRSKAYGPVAPGRSFVIHIVPWTRTIKLENGKKKKVKADKIGAYVVKKNDISAEDRKWMKKEKAKILVIAKLDKEVFSIKSGEAKIIGDENLKPLGARVKDAFIFGDVVLQIQR